MDKELVDEAVELVGDVLQHRNVNNTNVMAVLAAMNIVQLKKVERAIKEMDDVVRNPFPV